MGVIGLHSHFAMRKPKKKQKNKTKQKREKKKKRVKQNEMRMMKVNLCGYGNQWACNSFPCSNLAGLFWKRECQGTMFAFFWTLFRSPISVPAPFLPQPHTISANFNFTTSTPFHQLKVRVRVRVTCCLSSSSLSLFPRLKPSENWKPKTNPFFFFFFFPFSTFLANLKKMNNLLN